MSREEKCGLHNTKAENLCLYHREPICVGCKYDDRHKFCPQDYVAVTADIPPSDQDREELYDVCRQLYDDVLDLEDGDFSQQDELKNKLNFLFGNFKSKINDLQTDTEKCVDETRLKCKKQYDNVKQNCSKVRIDIGKEMKKLFENARDLSEIGGKMAVLVNIVDDKAKEMKACDPKYQLGLQLARVFDHAKVVTLWKEILSSEFIDSLFPPVSNPKFELVKELDTSQGSPEVKITGCTVLHTGEIVLADNKNAIVLIYTANGNFVSKIKMPFQPHDITEREGELCVTFPSRSQIGFISKSKITDVICTRGSCYGIEYGGGKLVVSCHLYGYKWLGSLCWQFCIYGTNNKLLQVVEKDRLGEWLYMSNGYFDFCPFRDQIVFLSTDGKAYQLYLTGPSRLKTLGELGSRNGEKLTALRSSGSTVITCHTESTGPIPFLASETSVLRLQGPIPSSGCEINFENKCAGAIHFDVRSRILVVCENRGSKYVYVLKF